jgi:hypothetical protein
MLSYEEIGSAAMMSRACAGTIGKGRRRSRFRDLRRRSGWRWINS